MFAVYRVFRATVTLALLAVFVALLVAVLVDIAGEGGILADFANRTTEAAWNPINLAESIPGFWPGLLFTIGIAGGMWLEPGIRVFGRWRSSRAKRRPLLILYDPDDRRFVHRELPDNQPKSTMCFSIAVHNPMGDKPVQDVSISVGRNAFVKSVVKPLWGAPTRRITQIGPNATEFVELFVLPEGAASVPAKMLAKAQRLVVRVRAKGIRGTTARFVFNAQATPMLRRMS
jgi:hypothetical protein